MEGESEYEAFIFSGTIAVRESAGVRLVERGARIAGGGGAKPDHQPDAL
jgi:hypothetical protein